MANSAKAASTDSLPQRSREALKHWEDERKNFIMSCLDTQSVTYRDITHEELLAAIKLGKYTALGKDGVTYEIFNCL